MFKVIIAGGRDFNDYELLKEKCITILSNHAYSQIEIVSGKARGADTLGERFAEERGMRIKEFPANWSRDGSAAGPIRNRQMANYADALIAFHDGRSRGTAHMIQVARDLGLKVRVIKY